MSEEKSGMGRLLRFPTRLRAESSSANSPHADDEVMSTVPDLAAFRQRIQGKGEREYPEIQDLINGGNIEAGVEYIASRPYHLRLSVRPWDPDEPYIKELISALTAGVTAIAKDDGVFIDLRCQSSRVDGQVLEIVYSYSKREECPKGSYPHDMITFLLSPGAASGIKNLFFMILRSGVVEGPA